MSYISPTTWRFGAACVKLTLLVLTAVLLAVPAGVYAAVDAPAPDGALQGPRVVASGVSGDVYAACVFVAAGPAFEDEDTAGITSLLNSVILNGGGPSPEDTPAYRIEALGGRVDALTYSDYACFRLAAPSEAFGEALETLAGALCSPVLTEYTLDAARFSILAQADMKTDTPEDGAYRAFMEKTYEGTPYAHAIRGDGETLSGISVDDLALWHKDHYGHSRLVVSVSAGDGPEDARAYIERAFGPIVCNPGGPSMGAAAPVCTPVSRTTRYEAASAVDGSAAMLGYTAPGLGSPDYAAVKLAEAVVAEGMGSRLFRSLRGDDRLAYSFGSIMPDAAGTSRLAFYVSADDEKIERAVEAVRNSVEELKDGGPSGDELDRARAALIGDMRMVVSDPAEAAWRNGLYELMGLGPDYGERLAAEIENVGPEDIREVARRYLDKYTLVILKPESRIR